MFKCRCDASWEFGLTSNLKRNRLQFELNSTETLSINVTSTLIELYSVVKLNWMQDYYSLSNRVEASPKSSPPGYRRRSPFVPFALRNYSGCKLWFTTIVTTADMYANILHFKFIDIINIINICIQILNFNLNHLASVKILNYLTLMRHGLKFYLIRQHHLNSVNVENNVIGTPINCNCISWACVLKAGILLVRCALIKSVFSSGILLTRY